MKVRHKKRLLSTLSWFSRLRHELYRVMVHLDVFSVWTRAGYQNVCTHVSQRADLEYPLFNEGLHNCRFPTEEMIPEMVVNFLHRLFSRLSNYDFRHI